MTPPTVVSSKSKASLRSIEEEVIMVTRRCWAVSGLAAFLLALHGAFAPAHGNPCTASAPPKVVSGIVKAVAADGLVVRVGQKDWTFALGEAVLDAVRKP
jgi:hypothetical protein